MYRLEPDEAAFAAQLAEIRKRRIQLSEAEQEALECLLMVMRGNDVKEAVACVDGWAYHLTLGVNVTTMDEEIRIGEHRYETTGDGAIVLVLSPSDLRL